MRDEQEAFGDDAVMSINGTQAYEGVRGLPPLVRATVDQAREVGFTQSCLPSHGRLLQLLAGGIEAGVIAETGTGCGVGLAWLASGALPGVRLVSVDHDDYLVEAARAVFAAVPEVEVVHGDWQQLRPHGPFDLLALDGGGQGKSGARPIEPDGLRPGGLVVVDDFTATATWPPMFEGRPDCARLHWLRHPRLLATQVRTEPDAVTRSGDIPGLTGATRCPVRRTPTGMPMALSGDFATRPRRGDARSPIVHRV
jgi:predicted O-methyltransferase YrrM